MVAEVYDAFIKAGVEPALAQSAAHAVIGSERLSDLATKQDLVLLRADLLRSMADMQASLIKWQVSLMVVMTGLFTAIVAFLKP